MAYLILGTICVAALLVFAGVLIANRRRSVPHAATQALIFHNGRLLQQGLDYTVNALGMPVFNIQVVPTDVIQRIRLHGTFVHLDPQDYQVRPQLQTVDSLTRFTPPLVRDVNFNDAVRRVQEALQVPDPAFRPLGVSMSGRGAVTRSEGNQEAGTPRFDRDLDV